MPASGLSNSMRNESRSGTEGCSNENVTGIVDPGVDTGHGDAGGKDAEGRGRGRQLEARRRRECRCRRRMTRRERRREWKPRQAPDEWDRRCCGPVTPRYQLEGTVHDAGGDTDRDEASHRGRSPFPPAGHAEDRGQAHPKPGMVRGTGQTGEHRVQNGRFAPREPVVPALIGALDERRHVTPSHGTPQSARN
jgi:hypothetical protein